MTKSFLRLACATAALWAVPAFAADLPPPPPMEDLRPATYDWSGPYLGVFAGAIGLDGTFDGTCSCAVTYTDVEHSGIGYAFGALAGWNYQWDSIVFGIEADWALGGTVATNDEPGIDTELSFDHLGTLRGRAGWAHGNSLLYVTGGGAVANMEFEAVMASTESENEWIWGWTVGGGIEHAFTDRLSARVEYLYFGFPDTDFSLTDTAGTTFDGSQAVNDMHLVRAALNYNFSW